MKNNRFLSLLAVVITATAGCVQDDCLSLQSQTHVPTRTQGDGKYETLGCGYDITGAYLDFYSIRKPVVDVDAFVRENASKYSNPFIGNITTKLYGGEDFESYIHEIQKESNYNFSLSVPGMNKEAKSVYSGEAGRKSSSKYEFSTKYSFARADIIKRNRHYQLDASPSALTSYLSKNFTDDLDDLTASEIIKKYGTHVLLNIEVGGIYKANYKSQIVEEKSKTTKTKAVKAGISKVLGMIGINLESSSTTTSDTQLETKNIDWEFEITSYGGTRNGVTLSFSSQNSVPTTTISIDTWAASVDDTHSVLVGINWENAYPLYDFISDATKKQELKNAIAAYLENTKVDLLELVPLYRIDRSDTKNTYNVYGDNRLDSLLHQAPNAKYRTNEGVIGYVLKESVDMYCEPLYSIDNTRTKNTFTVMGDSERHRYLEVQSGYKDRKYDGQTGYAYRIKMPNTLPMYRIDNSRTKNTFSVVGDDQKNYYLYQLAGYKDRSLDGQTGYIYPPDFD